MKRKYPYKDVTAPAANSITRCVRTLKQFGAKRIATVIEEGEIGFIYQGLSFVIDHNPEAFESLNGGNHDKAVRQSWALLRDYVRILVHRTEGLAREGKIRVLMPHLLEQGTGQQLADVAFEKLQAKGLLPEKATG